MGKHNFNNKLMIVKLMSPSRTLLKDSISIVEGDGCIIIKTDSKFNNGSLTAKLYKSNSYVAYFVDTVFSDMRVDPDQLYQFKKDVTSIQRLFDQGADVVHIKNEQEYFKRLHTEVATFRHSLTTSTISPRIHVAVGGYNDLSMALITKDVYNVCSVNTSTRGELVRLISLVTEETEETINRNLKERTTYTYGGVNDVHEVHVLRR